MVDASANKPYEAQAVVGSDVVTAWKKCGYANDSVYVNLRLELAKARFRLGDVRGAIADVTQVIKLYARKHPSRTATDELKAYYRLGFYYHKLNAYQEAQTALKKAILIGEQLPGSSWTAFAYSTLAYESYSIGEYQQAIDYAEKGIYQGKRANDPVAQLEAWCEKIKALTAINRRRQAQDEVIVAIIKARKTPDSGYYLALLLVHQAKLFRMDRAASKALACYREALSINLAQNNVKDIVDNYIDMGRLFYETKQYAESLNHYQKSLAIVTDPYVKLRILNNIGVVYWQQKRYPTALRYYQNALMAIPGVVVGRSLSTLPNAQSIQTASQKEFVLTLIQDKADAWLDFAKATGNRQYLQHALTTYAVADQMIDYMRWEHSEDESKFYWRTKTRVMYERAIETCWRLGNTEAALRFLEKSRAVMLADKLNELGARQKLTSQQNIAEQQVQKAVNEQQSLLADASPGKRYDSLRAVLLSAQEKQNAFRKQIEVSNPAYFRYKYDTTTTTLADLKAYLKPKQAQFVSYFVGDSALYVLAVAAGRDTLIRQSLGTYKETVRQFMNLLANPDAMNQTANVRQFLRLGNSLYGQLLAPLGLRGGRVIVSPDGAFVPLEALSRLATKPDYLVMTHAFSYAYSAGLLLKTQPSEPAGWRQTDFLGVAPVSYAPALGQVSLPGSDEAVQDIARRFGSAVLLIGAQATRRAFLTKAAHARVVHLFTHGTATDSTDTEPRLYFADSTLKLSELGTTGLPITQLVVLAACKTGVGSDQQGEGVFSMARGFAALGVPSVLTTLWSVDNRATYTITDLFEQYLTRGLPKDEALQQAQRDWLTTADGADQLPTYWAGLIVVGNAEPLSRPVPWSWLAAGLGGVVVVGAWLWRRKRRTTPAISSLRPA